MARYGVSWQFPCQARQFGHFVKYLPDGMVRVRTGLHRFDIPRSMLTIEVG